MRNKKQAYITGKIRELREQISGIEQQLVPLQENYVINNMLMRDDLIETMYSLIDQREELLDQVARLQAA